jgi:hypothetical protein
MGQGIVYCEQCGKLLREADFAKGKAQTIDDRHFCAACKAPAARSRPVPPTGSSTRTRSSGAAPARAGSSRLPLFVGGGIGVAILIVVVIVLAPGDRGAPPAPSPAAVAAPPDPAAETVRQIESFAATAADPEAVLLKCDEHRKALAGTRHEARFRQIESAALEKKNARMKDKAGQLDTFLAQIRALIAGDPAYQKRVEIQNMIAAARKEAGPRAADADAFRREYEAAFESTSRRAVSEARADAERLAGENKFEEALARLDGVAAAFRSTKDGAGLAALRQDIERRRDEDARLARVQIEGEDLKVLEKKGEAQPQNLRKDFGAGWSKDMHLWWREAKPGDVLRLEFPSNVGGKRKLFLALTTADDYGIVKLSVNGAVIAEALDLYSRKVTPRPEQAFEATLRKGPNELRVEIVGKNGSAKPNYMFGLDYLRIE